MPTDQEKLMRDNSEIHEPIRVLIVDDVKSARDLLRDILATDPGFEVIGEVADGLKAVESALLLRPNLITMDIRLPVSMDFKRWSESWQRYRFPS